MQMSFFDFEEFNELKAEAKKKEAPRKEEGRKAEEKSCAENGLQVAPYVKRVLLVI